MFSRRDRTTRDRYDEVPSTGVIKARGGVSLFAVLTGVVVSFGAFFLVSAIVGGILAATGVDPQEVSGADAGIGAGIALIAAFLISYLWGGYTAGRMSRGAGFVNGLLVPIVAILIGLIVGAIVYALGATANLNIPFSSNRLPIEDEYIVDWTLGIGIGALVAMFLGGILGGILGSRWHTKLERRVEADERDRRVEEVRRDDSDETNRVNLNDGTGQPVYGAPAYQSDQAPTTPVVQHHPSAGTPAPPAADRRTT